MDGLVERRSTEMDGDVSVIATGGLSGVIAAESRTIDDVDQDLTLDGLRIIFQRNNP